MDSGAMRTSKDSSSRRNRSTEFSSSHSLSDYDLAVEEMKKRSSESSTERIKKRKERANFAKERRREEETKLRRLKEEARVLEEKRMAEEARLNVLKEEARLLEEKRKDEDERIRVEAELAKEMRLAEESKLREQLELAREQRLVEEARIARLREEVRIEEERRKNGVDRQSSLGSDTLEEVVEENELDIQGGEASNIDRTSTKGGGNESEGNVNESSQNAPPDEPKRINSINARFRKSDAQLPPAFQVINQALGKK